MKDRIIIGTAGLDGTYSGPAEKDPQALVDHAYGLGFRAFDIASSYGRHIDYRDATVYAKVAGDPAYTWDMLRSTRRPVHMLLHNAKPNAVVHPWMEGVSCYAADLATYTPPPGIVQVDWSPVHRQATALFNQPKWTVHLRSIYLRGFLVAEQRDRDFAAFDALAEALGMTLDRLALHLALAQPVAGVVVGCNTIADVDRLAESVDAYNPDSGIAALVHLLPSHPIDLRTWQPSSPSAPHQSSIVTISTSSSGSGWRSQSGISPIGTSPLGETTLRSSDPTPTPDGTSSSRRHRPGGRRSGPST